MRHNPKHQFHIFLKRHEINYRLSSGQTWINNIYFIYRYDDETIRIGSPYYSRLVYTIPFCEPITLFKKFLRYQAMVKTLHNADAVRIGKDLAFERLYPKPRTRTHPQFHNHYSPII